MSGRADFLYKSFIEHFSYEPTGSQDALFRDMAGFLTGDDGDIMVVNGYAGTGKTSALAAVVAAMSEFRMRCVLLAPTGRSAKVLSSYTGRPAFTIHKHIYRRSQIGDDGVGRFSLMRNMTRDCLYIVDEVSLIGIGSADGGSAHFGSGNLLEDLIRFVRGGAGCRLVLIGDSAQLPPIGMDRSPALSPEYMSMAGGVRFAELTEVVRQQKESGILHNATRLRNLIADDPAGPLEMAGLMLRSRGFEDVEAIGGGELIEAISDAYSRYGEDETVILCRSNKRANRYNAGIRAQVLYREERLVRGEKLMVVRNCYQLSGKDKKDDTDYIANGDIARLVSIRNYEERYSLHFADACLSFPDYNDMELNVKLCLDTLESESASLTGEQQNALYCGVLEDYSSLSTKKKRHDAVQEDPYYNALQVKYAEAITCHKSQGGQWRCVFVDNPFWTGELTGDDLKWLYTAVTRATEKLYLVNFKDIEK